MDIVFRILFVCAPTGKEFECSIDNELQMEIDRTKWKSDQHAEKMFSGRSFIPPRIVVSAIFTFPYSSRKHLRTKVTPDFHLTYHVIKMEEIWGQNQNDENG